MTLCASAPNNAFWRCALSNVAAIALYRAEGFVAVARRAGYYPSADAAGAREDALVLRRVRTSAASHRAAITMAERIDILQELGLTPVWRLRARYRSDAAPIAPHRRDKAAAGREQGVASRRRERVAASE